MFKIFSTYICWKKYIKCNIWRVAVCPSYIQDAWFLKVRAQRLKWLGHIQRLDQARPTRKLLDWKPMGTRPVGKPRQRWQEDVMEDLKKLKVKNWKETAKDRRTWRDLAEKAKTHKGLQCQMMMMNIVILSCILISRHDRILSFLSIYLQNSLLIGVYYC